MNILISILISLSSFALTTSLCQKQGGVVVNTLSGRGCVEGKNIGDIEGTHCPCICCVGEKRVDCDKNVVEILSICDAGNFIKVKMRFEGKLPVEKISFELKGPGWFGGAELSEIDHKKVSYNVPLDKAHANKSYNFLSSYTVHFVNIPFEDCRFPIKKDKTLSIAPCP